MLWPDPCIEDISEITKKLRRVSVARWNVVVRMDCDAFEPLERAKETFGPLWDRTPVREVSERHSQCRLRQTNERKPGIWRNGPLKTARETIGLNWHGIKDGQPTRLGRDARRTPFAGSVWRQTADLRLSETYLGFA